MAGDDLSGHIEKQGGKLRRRFKQARRDLKALHRTAGQTLRAAQSLQSALRSAKPPPKPDAKLLQSAAKLQELVAFQNSARRYGELRGDAAEVLGPQGQRKWMLNGLVRMAETNIRQHTGGGNEGPSRRGAREAFIALKGLRAGQKRMLNTGARYVPRGSVPLDIGPDTSVSALDDIVAALKTEDKQIKIAQLNFRKSFVVVETQLDDLADAISASAA